MDSKDGKELLQKGSAYFVHRDGELLGIGVAGGNFIDTVITVKSGAGESVVRALASILTEDTVRLMVADVNTRAVRLYERLGFVKVKELSRWYLVYEHEIAV
jgi:ribosomal protein S18 acetylase RimI-like enzyme